MTDQLVKVSPSEDITKNYQDLDYAYDMVYLGVKLDESSGNPDEWDWNSLTYPNKSKFHKAVFPNGFEKELTGIVRLSILLERKAEEAYPFTWQWESMLYPLTVIEKDSLTDSDYKEMMGIENAAYACAACNDRTYELFTITDLEEVARVNSYLRETPKHTYVVRPCSEGCVKPHRNHSSMINLDFGYHMREGTALNVSYPMASDKNLLPCNRRAEKTILYVDNSVINIES